MLYLYPDSIKDVELQPNPDDAPAGILQMEVGEFITCSADGRPDPTYSWNCNDGQVIQGKRHHNETNLQ